MSTALAAVTVVSGLLAIYAEVTLNRPLLYVTKPLTMLLIASLFLAAPAGSGPHQRLYTWLVVAGIACSIAGDVFLMLESDRFVAGVASFLVAHLFYITAFSYGLWANGAHPSKRDIGEMLGALALYVFFVMRGLWPRLGDMRVPVAMYVVAISAMLSLAALAWLAGAGPYAGYAFAGALLFVASDTTLAFHRFMGLSKVANIAILGCYFAAQYLIVLSTR